MKAHLPRTASCLRRLLGGSANAWTRARVRRSVERLAASRGATPEQVVEAIRREHGKRLMDPEYEQLRLALELDLSAPTGGAA
jgi:hypothetical protein